MNEFLVFIENKEKIFSFFQSLPLYFYLIMLFLFLGLLYLYFKSKNNSKIVSGGSINIEGNGNIIHK